MQRGLIDAVVVGADRIAANGDTANKIGTYSLALAGQPRYSLLCRCTLKIDLSYPPVANSIEEHPSGDLSGGAIHYRSS